MKKIFAIIMAITLIITSTSYISYANENTDTKDTTETRKPEDPFFDLTDLKGRKELCGYMKDLKRIRNNINTINIQSHTSKEELEADAKLFGMYLNEMNELRKKLQDYEKNYSNSQTDIFAAEFLSFALETYVIGSKLSQSLMKELIEGNEDAKNIFYSQHANTIYYYFSLGDNQIAYLEVYFNLK